MSRPCIALPAALLVIGLLTACGSDEGPDSPGPGEEPSGASAITVRITTAGFGAQVGYGFSINGTPSGRTVTASSPARLVLTPGTYTITLDAPSWCSVDQPARTIELPRGTEVDATFTLTCSGITVRVRTEGQPPDTDGLAIVVDGDVTRATSIPGDGTYSIGIPAGRRVLTLGSLAAHCRALDGPREVEVVPGAENLVEFTVRCTGAVLRAVVTSSGPDQDANGYRVRVARRDAPGVEIAGAGVGTSDRRVIGAFGEGAQLTASLVDITRNCTADPASVDVTMPGADTVTVTFAVTCVALPSRGILLSSTSPGVPSQLWRYVETLDALVPLGEGSIPRWSPAEDAFAYVRLGRLYVRRIGEDTPRDLGEGFNPVFSPDGRWLWYIEPAFCQWYCDYADRLRAVDLQSPNLTTIVAFTATDIVEFDLSPDGRRVAYTTPTPTGYDYQLIIADLSSGQTRVLSPSVYGAPQFSPDGGEVLTLFGRESVIYRVDGGGVRRLAHQGAPLDWSPDGAHLLVAETQGLATTLTKVRSSDGGGREVFGRLDIAVVWASWK